MPKNKTQGIIFGIIMSYAMAFGMEIYNTAINHGYHLAEGSFSSMTNVVFLDALKEMTFMGLYVCRSSFYTLDLRENIPLNMILPLRQIICRSLLSF